MATQYTAGLTTGQVLTAATMNSIGAAAETWTPVVTQPGNITFTTVYAGYQRIQKTVFVYARLNITGAGTANNALTISLPITAAFSTGPVGIASVYDASAGAVYAGFGFAPTTSTITVVGDWAGNGVWGTFPTNIAIANGDVIWLNLTYEAA